MILLAPPCQITPSGKPRASGDDPINAHITYHETA